MTWIANSFEALNAVPYQVFCIMAVVLAFLMLIIAGIAKLLLPKSRVGHYLLFLTIGSVLGFTAATIPWLCDFQGISGRPDITVWPYWGRHTGPFSSSLVGVTAGLFCGGWLAKRNRLLGDNRQSISQNPPALPPPNPPPSHP